MDSVEDDRPSLWDEAFNGLPEAVKLELGSARQDVGGATPSAIVKMVEDKKAECEKKQWVLYTSKAGDTVTVREVLAKVCNWLDRFRAVGDIAVNFDPGHAALPWAAVRALMKMAVDDCQTFGLMAESIETVSGIITRYTEVEVRVLIRKSILTGQLSAALVKLYGKVLQFLAQAVKYYGRNTFRRALRSVISSAKLEVEEPILGIEKQENDVYKLLCLVQNECTGESLKAIMSSIMWNKGNAVAGASVEERCKKLSAWINGIDTKNTYETALQYHHQGTCEWVLKLPEFRAWASDGSPGSRLLWIHGPAGFGKTFLSAWIIQHLQTAAKNKPGMPCYFFCVADNELTRDPYAILRSWLVQLLGTEDEAVVSAMERVYASRSREQIPTQLGLWELFRAACQAIEGCQFVIDGFDECADIDMGARYHRNDPRNYFLRDLLQNLAQTSSRVLVVSRDVPDIGECLAGDSAHGAGVVKSEYKITAADTAPDVRSFSEFMVDSKLARKTEALRREIAAAAAERSDGMFLWIKLLEQEISPGQNAKRLRQTVHEMPSGISEAYARELDRIARLSAANKAHAVMLLRWVLFVVRPLQVKELVEALVVSGDDLDDYPEDDLPDVWHDGFVDEDCVKEMILGRCGSLLQLRSPAPGLPLAEHTVHFVHFSVKEYLMTLSSSQQDGVAVRDLGLADAAVEETRLSNICLRYLTLNTFEDVPSDTAAYPFLSYASWAWYYHSFYEKPEPPGDIMTRTRKAFDPSLSVWRVWTPVMEEQLAVPDDRHCKTESDSSSDSGPSFGGSDAAEEEAEDEWEMSGDEESGAGSEAGGGGGGGAGSRLRLVQNPIYYASLLGLTDIVKWLEDQGLDSNCKGGRFGFPLQAAVAMNRKDTVRHLLSRGVDIRQTDGTYGTAVAAAAAASDVDIVQALLDAGADAKSTADQDWTPLHHAVRRGSVAISKLLLERGADVNATARGTQTPILLACGLGHTELVRLLIDHGAKVDYGGDVVRAPHPALEALDNVHILAILLENGCPAGLQFLNVGSLLAVAVQRQNLQVVNKLLERGADANRADLRGWTPLQIAAANGNEAIIHALLDAGAAVSGNPGTRVATALQMAAGEGQISALKVLLDRGGDLNEVLASGLTALLIAVQQAQVEMVHRLLDMGADMGCIAHEGQVSPFDAAIESGNQELAWALVRRGCFQSHKALGAGDPEAQPDRENAVAAAYHGDIQKMEGFSSLPRLVLEEALRVASARGHLPIVKLLLRQRGVQVNARDVTERTALHHAISQLHWHVSDLLVERGADLLLEDMIGTTPIDLAVWRGADAADFIQSHMDSHNVYINRRPSLLAVTANQSANFSVMGTRKALAGSWSGRLKRIAFWDEDAPFSIDISADPPQGLRPWTFASKNKDMAGEFQIHGFVDSIGVVWFVKLYEKHGWLYRGQLDPERRTLRGTWGSNRKLWFGTFYMTKQD